MEPTMSSTKTCSKCKQTLPVEMFGIHKQKKDGLRAWCKPCNQADARRWSKENPAKKADGRERWKIENLERWKYLRRLSEDRRREYRRPKQRQTMKRYSEALTDNYVITALAMPRQYVTPELIELKRVQLRIHRLIKEQKEAK